MIIIKKPLHIQCNVGRKGSGSVKEKKYYVVQFSDTFFYKFLQSIGICRAKSKTLGSIDVPSDYFFDFLRGCFDGDGTFYSYWDPRWRSSHMFYIEFISAREKHIDWLRIELKNRINVSGHITNDSYGSTHQLKYAKKEAVEIIKKMYYNQKVVCLTRKKIKIEKALNVEKQQQKEYKK